MDLVSDVTGFSGAILFIVAYFLLSAGIIKPLVLYQCLNMAGALLLITSLLINTNASALFLEVVWFVVSLYALIRLLIQKKRLG